MKSFHMVKRTASFMLMIALLSVPSSAVAQTKIEAPKNPYNASEDVRLGSDAARQVERDMPILNDYEVQNYLTRVGRRLVEAIPPEFQHREFRYSFKPVDVRDLNAFALPGGFTYVNRGLIEVARNESELAGVMAHEISHVALRHGTAQMAKGQKLAVGSAIGQIAGAILGGIAGGAVSAASQVGFGAYFLKYSRAYERQADLLGAQIMARAGYDPRDLANVFRTLEREGGGRGGPEWLSSHPNPGNRYEAINREADMLRVQNPVQNTQEFSRVQARLRGFPRARTMEEVARRQGGNRNPRTPTRTSTGGARAGEPPSRTTRTFESSDRRFRMDYPSNWSAYQQGGTSVTFAPEWAFDGDEMTHGAVIGYVDTGRASMSLDQSLDAIINELARSNPNLREERRARYSGSLDGERAMATYLVGQNSLGNTEKVWIIARPSGQGVISLLFLAPERDFRQYESTFSQMIRSFVVEDRFSR
jgi:Zn-dependent protease with chaperone function